jgi:hypothetical protein
MFRAFFVGETQMKKKTLALRKLIMKLRRKEGDPQGSVTMSFLHLPPLLQMRALWDPGSCRPGFILPQP